MLPCWRLCAPTVLWPLPGLPTATRATGAWRSAWPTASLLGGASPMARRASSLFLRTSPGGGRLAARTTACSDGGMLRSTNDRMLGRRDASQYERPCTGAPSTPGRWSPHQGQRPGMREHRNARTARYTGYSLPEALIQAKSSQAASRSMKGITARMLGSVSQKSR